LPRLSGLIGGSTPVSGRGQGTEAGRPASTLVGVAATGSGAAEGPAAQLAISGFLRLSGSIGISRGSGRARGAAVTVGSTCAASAWSALRVRSARHSSASVPPR
jgi:hypothetical protein